MDFLSLNPMQFFGMLLGVIIVVFSLSFILLKINVSYRKEIEFLKAENQEKKLRDLDHRFTAIFDKLERDLNGIGNKARDIESTSASLKGTIAHLDFQHEKLILSLNHVKTEVQNIAMSLDTRISELIRLELFTQNGSKKT